MCEKKILLWLMFHFSIPDLPYCTMPRPRRWLCAYGVVIFINYMCYQCFWLKGVYVGSAAGGNNEEGRRYRNWCWSWIHRTRNVTFYWVMGSVHSMLELNTNRRDCLSLYVYMYGLMDGWMCVGVYLFKTIYIFQQENFGVFGCNSVLELLTKRHRAIPVQ